MSTSQLALPFLITNLGGEMMYILEQRLHAQNIPPERSRKVLQDVIGTMYTDKFVEEMFKSQDIYSMQSTRGIFDRIAHSSIMRLNKSSMDKLYDLMTMGVKMQVVCSTYPVELLHVTMNHLEELKKIVDDSPKVCGRIDHCIETLQRTFSTSSLGELDLLRHTLMNFFQGKRIRVSLFLQEKMQNSNGSLVLKRDAPVPPHCEVPGVIRYFDASGNKKESEKFAHSNPAIATTVPLTTNNFLEATRVTVLGKNVYLKHKSNKDRKKGSSSRSKSKGSSSDAKKETEKHSKTSSSGANSAAAKSPNNAAPPKPKMEFESTPERKKQAADGLNLLADLVGDRTTSDSDNFKLDLFGDNTGGDSKASSAAPSSSSSAAGGQYRSGADFQTFDGTDSAQAHLASIMKEMDIADPSLHTQEEEDLLDLLG